MAIFKNVHLVTLFEGNIDDHLILCDRRQCDHSGIKIESQFGVDEAFNRRLRQKSVRIEFPSDAEQGRKDGKIYFSTVEINGNTYQIGDYAQVFPQDLSSSPYFCKILSLFIDKRSKSKIAHVRWFALSHDTVLGNVAGRVTRCGDF